MSFGLPAPEGKNPKFWWGARAIFTNHWSGIHSRNPKLTVEVACLYDRQSFKGPKEDKEGNNKFSNWINTKGLPAIRKWAESVSTDGEDVFTMADSGFHIRATPARSYGYMYIGAWSDEEEINA